MTSLQRIVVSEGIGLQLNWRRAEEVIRRKDGVAWEVSQQAFSPVD